MPLALFHVRSIARTTSHRTLGPVNAGSWDPEIPGSLDLLQSSHEVVPVGIKSGSSITAGEANQHPGIPPRCVFGLARDNVGKSYFQAETAVVWLQYPPMPPLDSGRPVRPIPPPFEGYSKARGTHEDPRSKGHNTSLAVPHIRVPWGTCQPTSMAESMYTRSNGVQCLR